jgi:xylulokinase
MSAYEKLSSEYKISAFSIDTQGETLIVCDAVGRPLRNAIVWLDTRAKKASGGNEAAFGNEKIYNTRVNRNFHWLPACKLLWIKENDRKFLRHR